MSLRGISAAPSPWSRCKPSSAAHPLSPLSCSPGSHPSARSFAACQSSTKHRALHGRVPTKKKNIHIRKYFELFCCNHFAIDVMLNRFYKNANHGNLFKRLPNISIKLMFSSVKKVWGATWFSRSGAGGIGEDVGSLITLQHKQEQRNGLVSFQKTFVTTRRCR